MHRDSIFVWVAGGRRHQPLLKLQESGHLVGSQPQPQRCGI